MNLPVHIYCFHVSNDRGRALNLESGPAIRSSTTDGTDRRFDSRRPSARVWQLSVSRDR